MTLKHGIPAFVITADDLEKQRKSAGFLIRKAEWNAMVPRGEDGLSTVGTRDSGEQRSSETAELTKVLKDGSGDDLLSDARHYALLSVRTALEVALHVAGEYEKASGLKDMDGGKLRGAELTTYLEKQRTASAIALFDSAQYLIWSLKQYEREKADTVNVDHVMVAELDFSQPVVALKAMVFYLTKMLEHRHVATDHAVVQVVLRYAELVTEEIKSRETSLRDTAAYTECKYTLEGTNFAIEGFAVVSHGYESELLRFVYEHDVIGNDEALVGVREAISKLFLYDWVAQFNPQLEMGGLESVQLLYGWPGEGKSLMGAYARTYAHELAQRTGAPHQDIVIPNMVSKMQGESTDLANDIIRRMRDPRLISLTIGDEWEAVMPDHGGEDVSEGDRKVAVAWLKGLSGVATRDIGNFLLLAMSNYPGRIDKAFMSRIKARHQVRGAETFDDYVRFVVLNLRGLMKTYSGLLNLTGVDWDMDTRAPRVPDTQIVPVDQAMGVPDIKKLALEMYEPGDVRQLAAFFWLMKKRKKEFSLRDCANTIDAAKARVASFKVPDELFDKEEEYRALEPDGKRGKIKEVAQDHVRDQKIDFAALLMDQATHYAENSLRILEEERNRAIESMVEEGIRRELARTRIAQEIASLHQ